MKENDIAFGIGIVSPPDLKSDPDSDPDPETRKTSQSPAIPSEYPAPEGVHNVHSNLDRTGAS